jgi:hypothetical protein
MAGAFDSPGAEASTHLGLAAAADGLGPDSPGPRSRRRLAILGAVLVLGVAGLGVLGWSGWQVASQKDAKLTPPATVAGLRLDDSAEGRETSDYLQTALAAQMDLDRTVGAVYIDGGNRKVLLFGGTALIWSPDDDLERAFTLIADDQGAVTGTHDIPAGKYGGTMRCGTTQTADGPMPVCGWADHGSLAVALFPNRGEDESATLLRQLRDAAQRR